MRPAPPRIDRGSPAFRGQRTHIWQSPLSRIHADEAGHDVVAPATVGRSIDLQAVLAELCPLGLPESPIASVSSHRNLAPSTASPSGFPSPLTRANGHRLGLGNKTSATTRPDARLRNLRPDSQFEGHQGPGAAGVA